MLNEIKPSKLLHHEIIHEISTKYQLQRLKMQISDYYFSFQS